MGSYTLEEFEGRISRLTNIVSGFNSPYHVLKDANRYFECVEMFLSLAEMLKEDIGLVPCGFLISDTDRFSCIRFTYDLNDSGGFSLCVVNLSGDWRCLAVLPHGGGKIPLPLTYFLSALAPLRIMCEDTNS